jgi:uncharacterized membrane protein YhaH (DUF805 family)
LSAQFIAAAIDLGAIGRQILSPLLGLATVVPSLAVGCRRLHDTNRSGWWQLLGLVALVGDVVLLIFWALKGTEGPNRFGPPVA